MSICYITLDATGAIIRAENETFIESALWCKRNGYTAADITFSASPPRVSVSYGRARFQAAIAAIQNKETSS